MCILPDSTGSLKLRDKQDSSVYIKLSFAGSGAPVFVTTPHVGFTSVTRPHRIGVGHETVKTKVDALHSEEHMEASERLMG